MSTVADTFLEILGTTSDSFGAAGAPVKLVRAWWRRDEAKNMARTLEAAVKARWSDEPTRSDVYTQIARHLQRDELATPFHEAVNGDAAALERVRAYLAASLGTESDAASVEVADTVAEVIANHIGRAQTDPQAAIDAVARLRHEQAEQQFAELRAGQERIFDAIREGASDDPPRPGLAEALIRGPLSRVGAIEDVRRAEERGDADLLLDVARRLDEAGVGIAAESLRERAAALLAGAGRAADAARVLLAVARARLESATGLAELSIRALGEVLSEDEQWVGRALAALDAWTASDVERANTLADAASRAREAGRDDALWFAARAVDFFALHGQSHGVIALSDPIDGDELADGDRLAVELDRLWALEQRDGAEAVRQRWSEVLRWVDRDAAPASAGLAWQRYGATLADREDVNGSHDAYRRAMDAWSRVDGYEEQIADAFYSMQAASLVNARIDVPDADLRPLAYALRGGTASPAARIDRLLAEGMERRLSDRGARQAHDAFWRAYALARRSGSLQLTLTAAERLADLYEHAGEPQAAIGFFLAAGQGDMAAKIAARTESAPVAAVLDTGGPRSYRAAVYAVLTALGGRLPEREAARFGEQLITESRSQDDGLVAPQPATAAKRALAAVVLTLPDELRPAALDQLTALLDDQRYDLAKQAARALIFATNAGLRDATDVLLALFARDPYNYGISLSWVAERLEREPGKAQILRDAARAGQDPVLDAYVLAGLAGDAEIAAACEASAARWAALQPTEESQTEQGHQVSTGIVSLQGAGIVGRAATPTTRAVLLDHLLGVAADGRHPETTRSTAAGAVHNLAPALTPEQAATAVAALLPLARGEYEHSRWDENITHPLSTIRITWHTPGALRAAALGAVARLASEHGLPAADLQEAVNAAVDRPEPLVVAAAYDALAHLHALTCPVPIEAAMRHPEPEVRIAGLAAYLDREQTAPPEPLLAALVSDPVTDVRLTLVRGACELPGGEAVTAGLADDPDAYLRALARRDAPGLP